MEHPIGRIGERPMTVSFNMEDKRKLEIFRRLLANHLNLMSDEAFGLGSACSIAIDIVGFALEAGYQPDKEWLLARVRSCPRKGRPHLRDRNNRLLEDRKLEIWKSDIDPREGLQGPKVDFGRPSDTTEP